VVPRACLVTEARGKILSPLLGINYLLPGRPAHSQTLYGMRYTVHRSLSFLKLYYFPRNEIIPTEKFNTE
jgi:hypothetical protein